MALGDSLGLFPGEVLFPLELFQRVVRHFDGQSTLKEIRDRLVSESGPAIELGKLENLVSRLERAMVLEGPTTEAFAAKFALEQTRLASHAGRSYPGDVSTLSENLDRFFDAPRGAGRPSGVVNANRGSIRAILSPHIDFGRGGPVYTHAYRELAERSDAEIFVIFGVAHQSCANRFALTRKDFATPLGTARTDRNFVDHLAQVAGTHLFDDELAHRTEHSIEFQVVFLQHMLGSRRDFAIVPILVGSFHDWMKSGVEPAENPEVASMIHALRSAEEASGKKVAYIGGIDLCHVGPDFGDPAPVDDAMLETVRAFDSAMLDRATARDSAGWFAKAAEVDNRWRVCGLAATYTLLEAIGPASGRILSYDQAVNSSRTCCVSFASVAFESAPAIDHV